ncbi:MAG: neuraminidase-like domain-containing protein [Promethearchaeota archaeon]
MENIEKLKEKKQSKKKEELNHDFYANNKTRMKKIHCLLEQLDLKVDLEEKKSRLFGKTTDKAIKQFQKKKGLPVDGRINKDLFNKLNEEAFNVRFTTKTQVGKLHRILIRAAWIAKLGIKIDPKEIKKKTLGETTREVIIAFQKKYSLNVTGKLDIITYERIISVAFSRPFPIKKLKVRSAENLSPIKRILRLNMTNKHVGKLQEALAFLGYKINQKEYNTKTFGKSTREAVLSYQSKSNLPVNGHVERATLAELNLSIKQANPKAFEFEHSSRVRGSVRDDLWRGMENVKVQVWEKALRGEGTLLGERKTLSNGFFDVPYDPPRNPLTGKKKRLIHLLIKVLDHNNNELFKKVIFRPSLINWINFTDGAEPYRGRSEYKDRMKSINKVLDGISITELKETNDLQEIIHVALNSRVIVEDLMQLRLCHLAAKKLNNPIIKPEVFYAYIRQNLHSSYPSDLTANTEEWTENEQLVDYTINSIVFMEDDLKAQIFDNAIKKNLIPIEVGRNKDEILSTLSSIKQIFALEKPILSGNGNLRTLLNIANVNEEYHIDIAKTFLKYRYFNLNFWSDLKARAVNFGGIAVIDEFEKVILLGQITNNHVPTLSLLKSKLDDSRERLIQKPGDIAKLTHDQWVNIIKNNGDIIPEDIEGDSLEEKSNIYASKLSSQSEKIFFTIALIAKVKQSNQEFLKNITEIQQLLDLNPDLDLSSMNLNKFFKQKQIPPNEGVLGELRVLQRISRISPNATAGAALIDEKIHCSKQIVSFGREKFVKILQSRGINQPTALTIFGNAEFQYAQVLARIADFRSEFHHVNPSAIINHTYTQEDDNELLEDIPNLETLFGSLDFCDCKHCQSVYSPSAYLADLLRFLDNQDSKLANKTVKDILFERRPDIGNIKLNCENTNTPLPYIDLICEILENALPAENVNPNFSFQTTLSKNELRAFPENILSKTYDFLKNQNYPINNSFNLWQEESRIFLQHLGVSRFELMEAFQIKIKEELGDDEEGIIITPSDLSIAGEYWGISSHETKLIVEKVDDAQQLDIFWGFDTSRDEIGVSEFIKHAKINYDELLELKEVKWFSISKSNKKLIIERDPIEKCNLNKQKLKNLSIDKFDKIHRFLRLWRHIDWKMWELDLLIRSEKLGNNKLNSETLIRLKQFKQLLEKLGLAFEIALSFYHEINTEERTKPDEPQKKIQPLYFNLFQNLAITNPLNDKFWPLSGNENLSDHIETLIAAYAITESDLDLLLEKSGEKINLENLTLLFNYINLAKGLELSIKDLLTLEKLIGIENLFISPKQTLNFVELYEWLKISGFQILELDYILNYRPDSPYGLREEAITQYIQALREALNINSSEEKIGQIISQISNTFSITDEQAKLLLYNINFQGLLIHHLEVDALTEKDNDDNYINEITPGAFPEIYASYNLLHKASMLVKKHKIEKKNDLEWILTKPLKINIFNFNDLPINSDPDYSLFPTWLTLNKWFFIKQQYPEPENTSLRTIFDKASNASTDKATIFELISDLTTWRLDDLYLLDSAWQFQHNEDSDYIKVDNYIRLQKCFKLIKRIGVDAEMILAWAKRDDDIDRNQFKTAQQIKQIVKSKYDYSVWLSKLSPFQDELREKKCDALVSFLIEHSLREENKEIIVNGKRFPNPRYWKDSNDLLSYFLIDVEMSSCQLTSRIKQAISSIQMFVQRCFLNLEQLYVEISKEEMEDIVSLNSWKQWEWMKNYRIWEANRKVFLYPENWIEPELRDDKSPFFKELENEILQNEITHENVESAFLHYLQKLHEVSRLEIVGAYHEQGHYWYYKNIHTNNLIHVIGRTKTQPNIYYYRQFDVSYNTWTTWERIELDITGNHIIPVVYNRKLYLFWLLFTEKAQRVRKQPPINTEDTPEDSPEPLKMLEIQLAWSVKKKEGWTPTKVSQKKLIHPWERPLFSYNLKPRYKPKENLLWLDLYISVSIEFNNSKFYDPYRHVHDHHTRNRYDETLRPWHSSSFVFDGEVVDLKMKPLVGFYRIPNLENSYSEDLVDTNSYAFVQNNFGDAARAINKLVGPYEIAPRLPLPDGMHYHNTYLINNKNILNWNKLNILEDNVTTTLLDGAQSPFKIVFSQHQIRFDTILGLRGGVMTPFFYQDNFRAFFIKLMIGFIPPLWNNEIIQYYYYKFYPFYHPYSELFIHELNRSGLEGLLNRKIQIHPRSYHPKNDFYFKFMYRPKFFHKPDETAERDIIDFTHYGAYSIYNWEIFFHAPLMIACRLSLNQRFEESMRWFHSIFNPTNTEALSAPQRYWITKPFFKQNSEDYRKQRIERLLENIGENLDQLKAWKNDPFNPHLIAHYRPIAYQKTVVMKYIDNLIAWGDQLFRQDSIESLNEATMLYILAYELLGPRPVKVPELQCEESSYNELVIDDPLDPFGNKRVEVLMENFTEMPPKIDPSYEESEPLPQLDIFYFCIPHNEKLLEYWNIVEDRLFKIRHCMNIEGITRQLPLFEPPIDPALLVKAAASGIDTSSMLKYMAAPIGHYRFKILVSKAIDFCNEVKSFGDKLLSAKEKRDAEGLKNTSSTLEIELLEAIKRVKEDEIREAKETLEALERAKASAEKEREFYDEVKDMNKREQAEIALIRTSHALEAFITLTNMIGKVIALFPDLTVGLSGLGPHNVIEPVGGDKSSKAEKFFINALKTAAKACEKQANLISKVNAYKRRGNEYYFKRELANIKIGQINKQIEAAKIRYLISEKELENHELQINQAKIYQFFMKNRYTGQQLYHWMINQLATVYLNGYHLALDMAKLAERSFQFELCKPNRTFIQNEYWDSLRSGLLAGEKLSNDIRRMESAYYNENKREFEITKHISLAHFFPRDLLILKGTGACSLILPEWLFDMDYAGHYRRRIKSVSITISCITEPYTNINCTLSLTNNAIRLRQDVTGGYGDPLGGDDPRFFRSDVPVEVIVTSHGQNDAGLFELDFNDERYLPFEGAGVISEWQIKLPKRHNHFDFATLSDVILHISYTAKAGNINLVNAAEDNLKAILPQNGVSILLLNQEFSNEWDKFLYPGDNNDQELVFTLEKKHLPFYARNEDPNKIKLVRVDMIFDSTYSGNFDVKLQVPGMESPTDEIASIDPNFGQFQHLEKEYTPPLKPILGEWKILFKKVSEDSFQKLSSDDIHNVYLIFSFIIQ